MPKPDPRLRAQRVVPKGEVADAANPPANCAFHPCCRFAVEHCRAEELALVGIGRPSRGRGWYDVTTFMVR